MALSLLLALPIMAKSDNTREVRWLSHWVQVIALSASLIGRRASNLVRQSEQ
jgi:hypothetical protein